MEPGDASEIDSLLGRRLLFGAGFITLWLIGFGFLEYRLMSDQGLAMNVGNLFFDCLGIYTLLRSRKKFASLSLSRFCRISLASFFVFAGLGDLSYALVFYVFKIDSRMPWTIPIVSGAYASAFLGAVIGLVGNIQKGRIKAFILTPALLGTLAISVPIFWAFLLRPYVMTFLENPDPLFHIFEAIAVFSSFALFNLGLLVFISSPSLFWSLISAALVSIVFGDWAMRAEKILGITPKFGPYEFHWTYGIAAMALTLALISNGRAAFAAIHWNSIFTRIKVLTLLLALASVFLVSWVTQEERTAIQFVAIGSGICVMLAGIASFYITEWIKGVAEAFGAMAVQRATSAERLMKSGLKTPYEFEQIIGKVIDENVKDEAIRKLTAQVAHDIRSPLAALAVVEKDLEQLSEDTRLIIRSAVNRIQDIANDLLSKYKRSRDGRNRGGSLTKTPSIELLSPLIAQIVTEKRIEYRSRIEVQLDYHPGTESFGLFAEVVPSQLKRVISNLLNNSFEAIPGTGSVALRLNALDETWLQISVQDTGRGIPEEVRTKLGNAPISLGKESGSGLGIYTAQSAIRQMGGSIAFESSEVSGTVVRILLPQADPPRWFLERLTLPSNSPVIILDDDESIHRVWKGRLEAVQAARFGIELVHLSTPTELRNWMHKNEKSTHSTQFLVDYELLGYLETGIDLIEEFKIHERSILVSSRYEDSNVRDKCETLKIPLLPKELAGFIPVSVVS